MKHTRLLRNARWTLTAISILLFTTWLASGRVRVMWSTKDFYEYGVSCGCLYHGDWGSTPPSPREYEPGLQAGLNPSFLLLWRSKSGIDFGDYAQTYKPLWPLVAASLIPTTILWTLHLRATRRARAGNCAKCNYSLSGLTPPSPCPECGTLPTPSPSPPPPP